MPKATASTVKSDVDFMKIKDRVCELCGKKLADHFNTLEEPFCYRESERKKRKAKKFFTTFSYNPYGDMLFKDKKSNKLLWITSKYIKVVVESSDPKRTESLLKKIYGKKSGPFELQEVTPQYIVDELEMDGSEVLREKRFIDMAKKHQ